MEKTEKKIILFSLLIGIVLLCMEIGMAVYTHSQAMLMDALYDTIDVIIVIVTLFLVNLYNKPISEKKPFGFLQLESFFILLKTFMILSLNISIIINAIILIKDEKIKERVLAHAELLDIDRNNCFSLVATETAYREGRDWFEQVSRYIEENMDFASSFCKERIPQIQARKPEGTYLMWLDCRGLGLSGSELNRFMVEQAKVGFGEGIWFGPEGAGFERCTAACPRPILQRGLEQIESAVKKLGK